MNTKSMRLVGLANQREELEDVIRHFSEQAMICEYNGLEGQASKFWEYVSNQKLKLTDLDKKLARIGV